MKILIIRSCDRDALLAELCVRTAIKHNVADKIILFHEGNMNLNLCVDEVEYIFRESCDNFGGGSNVLTMLAEIKAKIPPFNDFDDVIFSDSDIIFLKNPFEILPKDYEHAGHFNEQKDIGGEINHVSGQLNIIKGWIWNKYIENGEENYNKCREILDTYNYSIADDSIFSVFAHKVWANQYRFKPDEYWLHYKIKPEEFEKYLNL